MIKSAPYYWIECDNCGETCPAQYDEYSAWADEAQAIEIAMDLEWQMDDQHLCPECCGVTSHARIE